MPDSRDVTTRCFVAGGGPAGLMVGYLLARAGIDVIVAEKWSDFIRDFRGDTIHPSTMQILHELGLLDAFLKLPHQETSQLSVQIAGKHVVVADFARLDARAPFIAFTPQWHFLNFIADAARKYPTFHLMMDTEVIDIVEDGARVHGVIVRNQDATFEIRADLVIGADGRHSIVRKKAGLEVERLSAPVDVLWFSISRRPTDPSQFLGVIEDAGVMVMIDRGEYWQCGLPILKDDADDVRARGIDSFREMIVRIAPFLDGRAHEIESWDQVKLLSVTVDRLRKWYRSRLVCIGDAAHAMSPVGGVGINLAIQDAVAGGNILVPAFRRGVPTDDDLERIQSRREFPTRVTQRFQVMAQERVLLPWLRSGRPGKLPFALRLIQRFPFLRALPARVVGIGVRPEHVETR